MSVTPGLSRRSATTCLLGLAQLTLSAGGARAQQPTGVPDCVLAHAPDGSSTRNRHLTHETATEHDGASFDWVDGEWLKRRSYVWKKRK